MASTIEAHELPSIAEVLERARTGHLWGRRCVSCGRVSFIDEIRCPACKGRQFASFESKGEGEVVAFTIVAFPAEAFASFGPFAFIVARMAEGGATTGWMPSIRDARQLKVGDKVRLVPAPPGGGITFEKA